MEFYYQAVGKTYHKGLKLPANAVGQFQLATLFRLAGNMNLKDATIVI